MRKNIGPAPAGPEQ